MKLLERLQETDKKYYKFLIPNYLSKQLTTYMSIREDLQYTLRALKNLSLLLAENTDKDDNTVETALWNSATFTYSKCFMDATKSKMTKLEPSEIFKEKQENIECHEYLLA